MKVDDRVVFDGDLVVGVLVNVLRRRQLGREAYQCERHGRFLSKRVKFTSGIWINLSKL